MNTRAPKRQRRSDKQAIPAAENTATPEPEKKKTDKFQPIYDLVALRKSPLLIMFWPHPAEMNLWDANDVYRELRDAGLTKEAPIEHLDLLIDTYGGNASSGYAIAQMIRLFTRDLAVIVPDHAYSAGTLLAFGGDRIELGDGGVLSPIDITLTYRKPARQVELAFIDSLMEFAKDCRKSVEEILTSYPGKVSTVESDVLVQMMQDIGAVDVGKYYRERRLTGEYATTLLGAYLFKDNREGIDRVVKNFLYGSPHHGFHMDYNLCRERGLSVQMLPTVESDAAKKAVTALQQLVDKKEICKFLNAQYRKPFFGYFPLETMKGEASADESGKGQADGNGRSKTSAEAIRGTLTRTTTGGRLNSE